MVLADHVLGHDLLLARALEEEGERRLQDVVGAGHERDSTCPRRRAVRILDGVKPAASDGVVAKRILEARDDTGAEERIVVWIERRPGAVWAVGRTVNQPLRAAPEPHVEDYVFVGYELDDALEAANTTLEDDVVVSEEDGFDGKVSPFRREELLVPLERRFFGR